MICKIIAVDFDGTLCENEWPNIGAANFELIMYLKREQRKGSKIILWTCRTGNKLKLALDWCTSHDLIFDAVNDNVPEAVESFGGDSRKIFAHEYIDDSMCTKFNLPFKTAIKEEIEN